MKTRSIRGCCPVITAVFLALALALSGCDGGGEPPPPQSPTDEPLVDAGEGEGDGEDGESDGGEGEDVAQDVEEPPEPVAEFGDACRSNEDCISGFCITSPRGFVCTESCISDDDCPFLDDIPMDCRLTQNFGPDGVQICSPSASSLCQSCFQDSHCFGGSCVPTEQNSICGLDCDNDGDCPEGTNCSPFSPTGVALSPSQCLPSTLACDCTEENAGEERACVREQEGIGRCFGAETCDPTIGWFGCDAEFPSQEVCDGVDNNCNGAVDDGLPSTIECENTNDLGTCRGLALCDGEEGFVCQALEPAQESCDLIDNDCDDSIDEDFKNDDGLYNSVEHCGVCNNNCDGRFNLAEETECQVVDDVAQCVITRCRRGFALAGPTTCLPLASSLCQPCAADGDCNADVGDACVDYPGGQTFCGRDCSEASPFGQDCPEGYACDEGVEQCRLVQGTCLCGPNDSFIRACSIPDPNDEDNNCVGRTICDRGNLSACVPPEDECNEIDDDCDGIADNDFRDAESGAYFTDAHCGRCFNNCPLIFNDPNLHAVGECNGQDAIRRGETPRCILNCDPGFADVNDITADGCECQVISEETDEPDPEGLDEDCDGIDGQISRGLFVSRTGNDFNPGTIALPLRSIQVAIDRAGGLINHIYISAGVYEESISLRPGVSLFGGYSSDFRQRDLAGNETAILGQPPAPDLLGTINGININRPVTVAGFTVIGFDNNAPSGNSYAFHLVGCDESLVIRNNVIRSGNGGNGTQGGTGSAGTNSIDNAQPGQPQRTASATVCPNGRFDLSPGGNGGFNTCTDQDNNVIATNGGDGGSAQCPTFNTGEETGNQGEPNIRGGSGGAGGFNQLLVTNEFGQCAFCLVPDADNSTEVGVPGDDGNSGPSGVPGQGCQQNIGRVGGDFEWIPGPRREDPDATDQPNSGRGGDGLKGLPGGGGGGGGAGSGVQRQPTYPLTCNFPEVIGGGGGGGGAGGCGGTGGSGGSPGGGSFALLLHYNSNPTSLPRIGANRIARGNGGTGGDGGAGAEGGGGALGKDALALSEDEQLGLLVCSDPGGRGGDGGDGGAGGGGGGGCGGIAAGVFVSGHNGLDTSAYLNGNEFPPTGQGGPGGRGGVSIGNLGIDGSNGVYTEVAQ